MTESKSISQLVSEGAEKHTAGFPDWSKDSVSYKETIRAFKSGGRLATDLTFDLISKALKDDACSIPMYVDGGEHDGEIDPECVAQWLIANKQKILGEQND